MSETADAQASWRLGVSEESVGLGLERRQVGDPVGGNDVVVAYPLQCPLVALLCLGRLTELLAETAPDQVWQLLDWTARGCVVIVEWQVTRTAGGRRLDWRGIDKFHLREGRIAEERVYMDTAALRAARSLAWPEPLIRLD